MLKSSFEKRITVVLLAGIMGTMLLAGCSSQETSKAIDSAAVAEEASEEAVAEEAAKEDSEETVAEEADKETSMEVIEEEASESTSNEALSAATEEEITEEASADADEGSSTDIAANATDVTMSAQELNAVFENAVPYEEGIQVTLHTSSGDEVVSESPETSQEARAALIALGGKKRSWNRITGAAASSTLYIKGYDYSVWNMLDWDTTTCWAEGNPYSEGTLEGFSYFMDRKTRIDGFRIYPGYQKSKRVYRNNILPAAVQFEAGGYEIWFDLDDCLRNINNDGEYYWIDCTFSKPIYASSAYVMIGAVATYGSDPDYDCCISEFHLFHY